MKCIGLIGGMSWESSAEYYRLINRAVKERLGGFHSARVVMYSLDFAEIEELQVAGDWDGAAGVLVDAALRLERAGADFCLICTNTMHRLAPQVGEAIGVPLLHIADATAEAIGEHPARIKRVGLLGTRYTMEQDFYKGRLVDLYGLEVIVPGEKDRQLVHDVIYNELCLGKTLPESGEEFRRIIRGLADDGAEGVILGCTEIPLLVGPGDSPVPIFDTTLIHAQKAVEFALAG